LKCLSFFSQRLKEWGKVVREVLYGMSLHELDLSLKRDRQEIEHLFMLIIFGDLVGLPLLPPYYSIRLLPYVIPGIESWKRGILRERDLTDLVTIDI